MPSTTHSISRTEDGQIYATTNAVGPGTAWSGGMAFDTTGRLHITTTIGATDIWVNGFRLSSSGQVVVTDGGVGKQPYAFNSGFPFSKLDGALIRQLNQTPIASDPYVIGIRIGPLGGVYMLIEGVPPTIIIEPIIQGSALIGVVTTYAPGVADQGATLTARSWKVNGIEVGTGTTYTPILADAGKQLTISETWTNAYGFAVGTSEPKTVTSSVVAPSVVEIPVIVGPAEVNTAVGYIPAVVSGEPTPTMTGRQWYLSGSPIPGATNATYTPSVGDIGGQLSIRETWTNSAASVYPESITAPVVAEAGFLITESGDFLVTESADNFVWSN